MGKFLDILKPFSNQHSSVTVSILYYNLRGIELAF